jgi:hypothetical protein
MNLAIDNLTQQQQQQQSHHEDKDSVHGDFEAAPAANERGGGCGMMACTRRT